MRKKGKLPGPTETASFEKEYGADFFQIQSDAVKHGQKVIVLDDIIATGPRQIHPVLALFTNFGQAVPLLQPGRSSKSLELDY